MRYLSLFAASLKTRNLVEVGVLVTFGLILSMLGPAAAAQAPGCTWNVVPSVNVSTQFGDQNMLNAVAAGSTADVWAVGQVRMYAANTILTVTEHWDGAKWRLVSSPSTGQQTSILYGVAVLAKNDAWAVGYDQAAGSGPYYTLVEHWNGRSWSIVQDRTDLGVLNGVVALGPSDVWAVGTTNYPGYGVIEHWDGHTWHYTMLSDLALLHSVTAISAHDVWAVGQQYAYPPNGEVTYTLHFDGRNWQHIPSPSPLKRHLTSDQNWLRSVAAVSANDVWAVGETRDTDYPGGLDDTLAEHWNGSKWSVVSSPDPGGSKAYNSFWGAASLSGGQVWAVGSVGLNKLRPFSEQWNGTQWGVIPMPQTGEGDLFGVATEPIGGIWAVGDTVIKPYVFGTLTERCAPRH
jgi:hypothetical protein